MRRRLALMGLTLLVAGAACAQTYYKWTDAQGVTHYSEQPPAVKAKTIRLHATGDSSPEPAAAATTASPGEVAAALGAAKSDYRKQSCATARNNLKLLSGQAMVLDAGTVANPAMVTGGRKLSAEQREAAKVNAQKQIQEFCEHG